MAKRGRPRGSTNKDKSYPPEATPPKQKASPAKDWLERIDRAKKVKEEWRKQFRVDTAYEYFEGRHRPSGVPANEWITINLIYSDLRAQLPALYSTDPYFYVKVKKSYHPSPEAVAEMEAKAKIRQSMLNYIKGEVALKQKSRMSIFDAMFQFGVTKTLYKADRIENPDAGKPILGDDGRPILDPDTGAGIEQPPFLLENGRYEVQRLHPDDFIVDENAGPLEDDVEFMAHRMKRHIKDVQKDKSREAEYRKFVKPTEMLSEFDRVREQRKKGAVFNNPKDGKEPEIVVEWEVYDLRNRQWFVVAEGCDYFGISPEDVPTGIEKHPFSALRFLPRDSSWYPIPPVSQLIDPQREYCERRSKILTHAKRFNRKYTAFTQGLVDPQKAMAQLEMGDDGAVIEASTPGEIVFPIRDAPLDQQVHTELAYLRKDFDDLSMGANQRGSSTGIDSATEAGILERRSQIREGDQVALVTDFLISIGRKLDQLVQAHITDEMAIRVTGPEGEAWVAVKTEDYTKINGEFEYNIQVGSTTPQLPEIERAQMLAFLQILVGPGMLLALEPVLFKTVAEKFGLDDAAVEAATRLAQKLAQAGQVPGQPGSAPNTSGTPAAASGGAAQGINNIRGGQQ
jgi:hypothetical protein